MSSDSQLLAAWREGDQAAASELFERHFPALYRFFRNKVSGDVDDLVQKTFLGCVEARDRFRGEASVRTYLFAVARNVLADHLRERYGSQETHDFGTLSVAELGVTPSEFVTKKREHRLLLHALRLIPLDFQIAVELFYWERLSGSELGAVLDVPEGTARARLRRARQLLAEKLEELTTDPAAVQSTLDNLDRWASDLRDYLAADGG